MFANYIQAWNQVIVEHSDSMVDELIATAACQYLAILRSPTDCQDFDSGSQDKIEVKSEYPPPVTWMTLSSTTARIRTLAAGSWPTSFHSSWLPPV